MTIGKTLRLTVLFLSYVIGLTGLCADEISDKTTGTLVVTYHTGRNAERLDRVRFRLTNDKNESALYPEGNGYYEDTLEHVRRVVITGLEPGAYTLEFITPNFDGLFNEVPKREFVIAAEDRLAIDQAIKPRYARLHASAVFDDCSPEDSRKPVVKLCTSQGDVQATSTEGVLQTNNVAPGEYMIIFEEHEGYQTPEPLHVNMAPGTTYGPFQRTYTRS